MLGVHAEAALVKKWPRGSRWEDEDVGPKPYEGSLGACLLKDDADRCLLVHDTRVCKAVQGPRALPLCTHDLWVRRMAGSS